MPRRDTYLRVLQEVAVDIVCAHPFKRPRYLRAEKLGIEAVQALLGERDGLRKPFRLLEKPQVSALDVAGLGSERDVLPAQIFSSNKRFQAVPDELLRAAITPVRGKVRESAVGKPARSTFDQSQTSNVGPRRPWIRSVGSTSFPPLQ